MRLMFNVLGVGFNWLKGQGESSLRCQSANARCNYLSMRVRPFPRSTKTSAYVGQWGRLRFEGGSITKVLRVLQV
jgi:hypothetical protein